MIWLEAGSGFAPSFRVSETADLVTLRLKGAKEVIDEAVSRVIRARDQIAAEGGTVGELVLIFDTASDPTFTRYSALAQGHSSVDGSFYWRGVLFQVAVGEKMNPTGT